MGERLCGKLQRLAEGRATESGNAIHTKGGADTDGKIQKDQQ